MPRAAQRRAGACCSWHSCSVLPHLQPGPGQGEDPQPGCWWGSWGNPPLAPQMLSHFLFAVVFRKDLQPRSFGNFFRRHVLLKDEVREQAKSPTCIISGQGWQEGNVLPWLIFFAITKSEPCVSKKEPLPPTQVPAHAPGALPGSARGQGTLRRRRCQRSGPPLGPPGFNLYRHHSVLVFYCGKISRFCAF